MLAQCHRPESARAKATKNSIGGDAVVKVPLGSQNTLMNCKHVLFFHKVNVPTHVQASQLKTVELSRFALILSLTEDALDCAELVAELRLLGAVRAGQPDHLSVHCDVE